MATKAISMPKDSNFIQLKKEIFFWDKKLIKFFSFKGEKICENLRIYNYPEFMSTMDQVEYQEFTKGKFRCKKCRKYVRLSKLICRHSNKCRIFYNFKLKKFLTQQIHGGYEEEKEEGEEDFDEEQIYKEVDAKFNEITERRRRNMLKRINDLLFDNE